MGRSTGDRTCGSRTCDGRLPPWLPSGMGGRHAAAFKRHPATRSASSRPTACGPLHRVPGFWGTGCAWTARWPAAPWLRANGGPRQSPRPSLPGNLRSSRLELWPRLAFDSGCWRLWLLDGGLVRRAKAPADHSPSLVGLWAGCGVAARRVLLPPGRWAPSPGNDPARRAAAAACMDRDLGQRGSRVLRGFRSTKTSIRLDGPWREVGAAPAELPARLPDRPWRRCHDADRGCTIEEP